MCAHMFEFVCVFVCMWVIVDDDGFVVSQKSLGQTQFDIFYVFFVFAHICEKYREKNHHEKRKIIRFRLHVTRDGNSNVIENN